MVKNKGKRNKGKKAATRHQDQQSAAVSRPIPDETKQLIEEQVEVIAQACRMSLQKLARTEAELEDVTDLVAGLREKSGGGNTNNTNGVKREVLLERQLKLVTSANTLRTTAAQVLGRWTEDRPSGFRLAFEDYALINPADRHDRSDPRAQRSIFSRRRTSEKVNRFCLALIPAQGGNSDDLSFWCPISQQYREPMVFKAAHLVDVNIDETNAQALFGDQEEHIWSVDNGIIMHEAYKKLLDSAMAVILPVSYAPDEKEFQFILLQKNIRGVGLKALLWNEKIDGRRLVFKSDWRPPKRYLYFKFAMALLRRHRRGLLNCLEDFSGHLYACRELWASPGPCLKRSILYQLARNVGCLTMEQTNQFWGVDAAPIGHLSTASRSLSTGYALRLSQIVTSMKCSLPSLQEEEENGWSSWSSSSSDEDDFYRKGG